MGFSSRCKICTHPHAERINDWLLRRSLGEDGLTLEVIATKVADLGGPEVTICGLSRHASKHFDVGVEGRKRAANQYNEAADTVAKKALTDLEVMDEIITIGLAAIRDGSLKPDVKDMINAVKTKHGSIMKDENPLDALISLVAETARDGDD